VKTLRNVVFLAAATLLPASALAVPTVQAASAGVASAQTLVGTCKLSATVNFPSPGLSTNGSETRSKAGVTTMTGASLSSCLAGKPPAAVGGATSFPNLSIKSKNTNCLALELPDPVCTSKGEYVYDSVQEFENSAPDFLKAVKRLTVEIENVVYRLKFTRAVPVTQVASGLCESLNPNMFLAFEFGYDVEGTVQSPKADEGDPSYLQACLGTANAGTGLFSNDLGQTSISNAQLDPTDSVVNITTP
jgi:hypothetical protein